MNDDDFAPLPPAGAPITEADLHALADDQLSAARRAEVEAFVRDHPEAAAQVARWRAQNGALQVHFADVLDEPLPLRLPLAPPAPRRVWGRALAAGLALAVLSGTAGWFARGEMEARGVRAAAVEPGMFAHRAAVAHAVYASDMRRPVEMGGEHEQALVTWLTRRVGVQVHAPDLSAAGYQLMGGRLLPGGSGAVAQLMYGTGGGGGARADQRLTLYVTREATTGQTAFRFMQDGPVRVFYWIEGSLGYALSGEVSRDELLRVAQEVYRQLAPAAGATLIPNG